MAVEHTPERPSWTCRVCGDGWPCAPARSQMAAEYESDTVALSVFMWMNFEYFVLDSGPGPLRDTFDRFIGWTRGS